MRGFAIAASLAVVAERRPRVRPGAPASRQPRPAAEAGRAGAARTPQPCRRAAGCSRRRRFRRARRSPSSTCRRSPAIRPKAKPRSARVQALMQKKQTEGADKSKQLQANQQKLQQSGARDERAARARAREGHRAAAGEGRALPAGRAGRSQRAAAGAAGRVPEEALPAPRSSSRRRRGCRCSSARRTPASSGRSPGIDLTAEAIKKLDAATAPKPSK